MDRTSLEEVALRWMRFWQGGTLDSFDAIHPPTFVDHSAAGRAPDRSGLRQGIVELYRAFPDFAAVVDLLAIDDSRSLVTIRWTADGHMRGRFLGATPTGQRVVFTGVEIVRVSGELVAERWGEWDEGAILVQIGNERPLPSRTNV